MASKLRAKTRSKRTSKPRRSAKKNVDRFTRSRKTKATERAAIHSGESTGREKGIMASQKANKIKGLEQSVGSLDRRINTALEKGDMDLAKDLRSRQNKFTTKLGLERAIKSDGVARDSSGKIIRSSRTGQPLLTTAGRDIFSQTKDMDFIDPTRRIQNVHPDAYGKMYPISNMMQRGLPALGKFVPGLGVAKSIAKSALSPFKDAATDFRTMAGDVTGRPFKGLGGDLSNLFKRGEKRGIPYTDPMMPGERYPLDKGFGAYEDEEVIKEEDFYGGRSPLDEDSSLDDIIKRYTPPEPERKVPTDPDLEEQWPPSPFEPTDPNQEVVDEFGFSTTVPKEAIVKDVLKNLTENIAMEENIPIKEAEAIARNELSPSTLTPPSFNIGDYTKKFMSNNAENEAKTILQSLPKEVIEAIPPEVITSSSAIDIVNSLPKEIIEKTQVDIQTKKIPNIYQKSGEKVLTMEDLAAEAGTGPTLSQALPVRKMATTVADMIPYLATGYTADQWKTGAKNVFNKYSDMKENIFGPQPTTGWDTQDGGEWWKEQETIKDNTADLLKNQYNLNDDQIEELLDIKTGFNF